MEESNSHPALPLRHRYHSPRHLCGPNLAPCPPRDVAPVSRSLGRGGRRGAAAPPQPPAARLAPPVPRPAATAARDPRLTATADPGVAAVGPAAPATPSVSRHYPPRARALARARARPASPAPNHAFLRKPPAHPSRNTTSEPFAVLVCSVRIIISHSSDVHPRRALARHARRRLLQEPRPSWRPPQGGPRAARRRGVARARRGDGSAECSVVPCVPRDASPRWR